NALLNKSPRARVSLNLCVLGTLFVACLRPPGLDSLASCSRAFLGRPLLCCCDASSPSKSHSCWIFSPHVVLSTPLRSAAQESCLVLDRIHSAAYYSDIKTGRASACNTCPALTSSPVWRQTWLIITVPPIHPLNPKDIASETLATQAALYARVSTNNGQN